MALSNNDIGWYVLRATYSRELKVKEMLEAENVESFIPLRFCERTRGGVKKRIQVPVVHNIIFVHTSRSRINALKKDPPLSEMIRYFMDRTAKQPLIVPDKQMEDFIIVSGTLDERLVYMTPEESRLKKGDTVRIRSGILKGIEGKFVNVNNKMRVVVAIEGIMSVATMAIPASMVERVTTD